MVVITIKTTFWSCNFTKIDLPWSTSTSKFKEHSIIQGKIGLKFRANLWKIGIFFPSAETPIPLVIKRNHLKTPPWLRDIGTTPQGPGGIRPRWRRFWLKRAEGGLAIVTRGYRGGGKNWWFCDDVIWDLRTTFKENVVHNFQSRRSRYNVPKAKF